MVLYPRHFLLEKEAVGLLVTCIHTNSGWSHLKGGARKRWWKDSGLFAGGLLQKRGHGKEAVKGGGKRATPSLSRIPQAFRLQPKPKSSADSTVISDDSSDEEKSEVESEIPYYPSSQGLILASQGINQPISWHILV